MDVVRSPIDSVAPRALQRSRRVLMTLVRDRSINPGIWGIMDVTASSRSALLRRSRTLITTKLAVSFRARLPMRSLNVVR